MILLGVLFTTDYKQLSTEMEKLREGLKPKVAALHKLEGEQYFSTLRTRQG